MLALALVVVSRKRRRVDVYEAFLGEGKGEAFEPKVVLHESNVGLVTRTWAALLEQQVQRSGTGHEPGSFPVEALLNAMTVQTSSSRVLGGFMILVCKCDDANIKQVEQAWAAHGRPRTLRELLEREKRRGVQLAPGRLDESATLALVWAWRILGLWLGMLDVLADDDSRADFKTHVVTARPSSNPGCQTRAAPSPQ